VRAAIPGSLRAAVAGALPTRAVRELSARLALLRMNWTATRAFVCPGERNGYIRFNVAGRERDGIVAPAEVAALAAEICAGLASFRAEDGAPIVADVVRIDGELRDASGLLPDLVVLWSDTPSAGLHWAASPRFGTVERRGTTGLSGHHTADAWALLLPGSSRVAELGRPAHLLDIAATAHGLLGDPSGLPGTPLLVL
jgi:predicted AlkP superfamily phosphohydrolase/phosphomutase